MNYLIYINGLGPNYKGENLYEFIFSDTLEVWGENWESKPANGMLQRGNLTLDLVQESDVFSVLDSMDGVLCLGWEKENDDTDFSITKRLVFKFGETEQDVKDKLYARDIILEFEKKMVYEN